LVFAYEKSLRKQQLKSPKFYLFDCGVRRVLDNSMPATTSFSSQQYGQAFEHFIVCECMRLKSYYQKKMFLSHFNTGNAEIDLVVESPGVSDTFIEIKSAKKITNEHIATLKKLKKSFPEFNYYCFSLDPIARVDDGVEIVPWQIGLKNLFS
jgi:uncharacterized protein